MDFFTVPTITFRVLYCFFIISHDRRQILHFNVTRHPTSPWIVRSCGKRFLTSPLPATWSWIVTHSMDWKFPQSFSP